MGKVRGHWEGKVGEVGRQWRGKLGNVVRAGSEEVARLERCEGSDVARWERWENGEVPRWEVPGFIQEWETQGDSWISPFCFWCWSATEIVEISYDWEWGNWKIENEDIEENEEIENVKISY